MSGSQANTALTKAVVAGALLTMFVGGLLGIVLALFTRRPDQVQFWSIVSSAACVGGTVSLLIGLAMAWHGAAMGRSPSSDAAPIWGLLTGGVIGLSFGPVLGCVAGLAFQAPASGGLLGLSLGPAVGILGWQVGFWLCSLSQLSGSAGSRH